SWRVRLDVQTIGHRHNEQGAQAGARRNGRLLCRGFVDVEDRRNLRRGAGGRDEQTEQQREWGRLRTEGASAGLAAVLAETRWGPTPIEIEAPHLISLREIPSCTPPSGRRLTTAPQAERETRSGNSPDRPAGR